MSLNTEAMDVDQNEGISNQQRLIANQMAEIIANK